MSSVKVNKLACLNSSVTSTNYAYQNSDETDVFTRKKQLSKNATKIQGLELSIYVQWAVIQSEEVMFEIATLLLHSRRPNS